MVITTCVAALLECGTKQRLGSAARIAVRRIEQIDAGIERLPNQFVRQFRADFVDRRDIFVSLREGHRAEGETGYGETGIAEKRVLHGISSDHETSGTLASHRR